MPSASFDPSVVSTVDLDGLTMAYLSAGDPGAPLAVCLHGFPDAAPTWSLLAPSLVAAGYRVVAPWLRGYAPTAVPADGRYQTGASVADITALHEALGGDDSAVLIGHDWGAMIAYGAVSFEPTRWSKLVTLAVPPAGAIGGSFLTYDQLQRSWYMFFFQHPLSDFVVGGNDLEFVDRLWADWSPGFDGRAHLPAVKDALRDPSNLAAALGYYRSMLGAVADDPVLSAQQAATQTQTAQPTLYIHGADDGCVGTAAAAAAAAFLPNPASRVEIVAGSGHFLHLERPDVVNALVVDFLTS